MKGDIMLRAGGYCSVFGPREVEESTQSRFRRECKIDERVSPTQHKGRGVEY